MNHERSARWIVISIREQRMDCYNHNELSAVYAVSTAKNGPGEQTGSECTPRGWHCVHRVIGLDNVINSVFVGRVWTGEVYSPQLAQEHPGRDWILTRIIQLEGLEPGRNRGGSVDSLSRYIYIHGTPDTTPMGIPGSHGCVRMRNEDIVDLANWIREGSRVCIV